MTQPVITFTRIERTCKWNEDIRAAANGGTAQGIIYDFHVLIDGEHRATFDRDGGKYTLCYTDTMPIPRRPNSQAEIRVRGQAKFPAVVLANLDKIPTLAQYEAKRIEQAAVVDEGDARRRLEAQAEPALKLLQRYMDICGHEGKPLYDAEIIHLPELWEEANQVLIAAGL